MRNLPNELDNKRAQSADLGQVMGDFHNNWGISNSKKGIPSQSVSVNYANQFNQNVMPIGVVSNFSYKFDRELEPNKIERFVQTYSPEDDRPLPSSDFNKTEGMQTAELSGMFNIFMKPSSVTKLGLKTLYSNSATDKRTIVEGQAYNFNTKQTVSDFDRRTLFSATLEGETYFKDFLQSTLEGHISYNLAQRVRPDRRSTQYNGNPGSRTVSFFGDNNGHFFSNQDDNNYAGELKYKLKPFKFLDISAGGNVTIKDRRFTSRRVSYQLGSFQNPIPENLAGANPGTLFNDANVLEYMKLIERTQFDSDWYDGFQTIYGGFVSTKWQVMDNLSFEAGLRVEESTQIIEVPQDINGEYEEVSRVENTDFLPAINLTYEVADRTNIRAAYSQTLARPEFREISNFAFADYLGGVRVYGNPDLNQTNITNYDLRIERYPSGGQMFAVSFFYKNFEQPIEKFFRLTENNEVIFRNAKEANLYGVEVEGRKNITDKLQIVANASYIYSETKVFEEDKFRVANASRPMVGQSPYIVNTSLFYTLPEWNANFSLSYNVFGERIVAVGQRNQRADEYEQPFHDLGAKIDFTLGRVDLSLEASNLLNQTREYTLRDYTTFKFNPGINFKLGASISL
jgi:outer membrane receptor protein involved in Fe transport